MKDLKEVVKGAMDELYKEDKILFENAVSERCLVYNFALHLIKALSDSQYENMNVDIEYNRHCKGMKSISNQLTSYPDLILHKRGTDEENKMVIEFKKWDNKSKLKNDEGKLKCFKAEYNYELCMLVVFDKKDAKKVIYREI